MHLRCGTDVRRRMLPVCMLLLLGGPLGTSARAQGDDVRQFSRAALENRVFGPPGSKEGRAFYFTRAIYSSFRGGWGGYGRGRRGYGGGGRGSWSTDYPKADLQFMFGVDRLTDIDGYEGENAVPLTSPDLRKYPFLYMLEVGAMALTQAEVDSLRSYLDAGGFLVIDDFWGTREWQNFEREIRRVLPDRPIVELPLDHPIFHIYYNITEILQVPNVGNAERGQTWEQDGYVPHCMGISDENGRLLVVINWNTDLGDAWEWADYPYYPLKYSTYAYEMGINFILYAMSF